MQVHSTSTPAASGAAPQPAMAGLRVLDFGHIIAGPYCARLLADLGADVVKVESRTRVEGLGRGHLSDAYTGRRDRSPHMLITNRNRRSVSINLKTAEGVAIARRLATAADVLEENFSAGAMDRLGLGYRDLQPLNPRLVYLSASGYGHGGPRRDWTSMNLNLQAYSGQMMTTGEENDPPTMAAASLNDYLGSLHACLAVLGALQDRATTGHGAWLDLSQFECSVSSLGPLLLAAAVNHALPPRPGNRSETAAPQGCYRCLGKDEWCAISVQTDAQWRALVEVLSEVPQLGDARFADVDGRRRGHDEIDALIERWTSARTNAEVERSLQEAGVSAERVRRARDILDGPQADRIFPAVEDPPGHETRMAALPVHFSRSPVAPMQRSPKVGEHTATVLEEWLGLSAADVAALQSQEVLV